MTRASWGSATSRCANTPAACGTCASRGWVTCFSPARPSAWREKNPEVTICQVRAAANALLDALPLNVEDQKLRLAKAARLIRVMQARNTAARTSHAKTRAEQLKALGLSVQTLRCCIPGTSG